MKRSRDQYYLHYLLTVWRWISLERNTAYRETHCMKQFIRIVPSISVVSWQYLPQFKENCTKFSAVHGVWLLRQLNIAWTTMCPTRSFSIEFYDIEMVLYLSFNSTNSIPSKNCSWHVHPRIMRFKALVSIPDSRVAGSLSIPQCSSKGTVTSIYVHSIHSSNALWKS
jgi:hypothetical protein